MENNSARSPVARLLHRWFIQYNPLYLLSAALVLSGTMVWSRGLAQEGNLHGSLGVAAVAELYAVALIAGAAFLVRMGHRRPAVMLALLTVIYQGDLTLHTETCAYLGGAGAWAAAIWFALFVAKLRALAWTFQVRISPLAFGTAALGAFGLVVLPRVLPIFPSEQRGSAVALWLFVLLAVQPFQRVESQAPLDAWGTLVFRRVVRATWLLWLGLIAVHLHFWSTAQPLGLAPFLPSMALLGVRRIRSESHVWLAVTLVLVLVACLLPGTFWLAALFAAMVFALRAWPKLGMDAMSDPAVSPYRGVYAVCPDPGTAPPCVPFGDASRKRLLVGSMGAFYLSVWTIGWLGGPWPAHAVALDVAMTLAMLLMIWRGRSRTALMPPMACLTHAVLAAGLIPAPHSLVAWGSLTVGMGFALLFASLGATYWLRRLDLRG